MLTKLISLALNLKVISLGRIFSDPDFKSKWIWIQNEIKGNPITKDVHGNRMSQMALLWREYSGIDYHIVRKRIFYQNPYQGRKCSFSSTQVALGHKLIIHQMFAETLSTEIKWAQASNASPELSYSLVLAELFNSDDVCVKLELNHDISFLFSCVFQRLEGDTNILHPVSGFFVSDCFTNQNSSFLQRSQASSASGCEGWVLRFPTVFTCWTALLPASLPI